MSDFFVDIHIHPNLKAFGSNYPKPTANLWERIEHHYTDSALMRYIRKESGEVYKYSQSNFDALIKGNVRVVMLSITPLEKGFLKFRNIPGLVLTKKNQLDVMEHVTGTHRKYITHQLSKKYDYYESFKKEYKYIVEQQGKSPCGNYEFQIAKNYQDVKEIVKDPNKIAVILSVEGGYSLGVGTEEMEEKPIQELKDLMTKRIREIKSWEYPPFSINVCHHFWNQLCGHSKSIKGTSSFLVNQSKGIDKGMTELGRHVFRELLSRHNGPRINIDTKHMSVAARNEYFGFVRNYNYLNPDDKIPLICSHTGVNGYKEMENSVWKNDTPRKSKKSYFQNWSINVSDEEARIIHESDGIIGMILDKTVLGGGEFLKKLKNAKTESRKKKMMLKLLWKSIFQLIQGIGQKSAWDIIAIGSDYDGAITHIDQYYSSECFPQLKTDLISYLEETKLEEALWFGYTPKQLVDRIMTRNPLRFYEKYFV